MDNKMNFKTAVLKGELKPTIEVLLKLSFLAWFFKHNEIAIYGSQVYVILKAFGLVKRLTKNPNFLRDRPKDKAIDNLYSVNYDTKFFNPKSDIDILKRIDKKDYLPYAIERKNANPEYKLFNGLFNRIIRKSHDDIYHKILPGNNFENVLAKSFFINIFSKGRLFEEFFGYKQLPQHSKKKFDAWLCVCSSLEHCFDYYHTWFVGDSMILIYTGTNDVWKLVLKNNIGPFSLKNAIEYTRQKILVPTRIPNLPLFYRIDKYFLEFCKRLRKKMKEGYYMNGEITHYFFSVIFKKPFLDNTCKIIWEYYYTDKKTELLHEKSYRHLRRLEKEEEKENIRLQRKMNELLRENERYMKNLRQSRTIVRNFTTGISNHMEILSDSESESEPEFEVD